MQRSRASLAVIAISVAIVLLASPALSSAVSRADANAARAKADAARAKQTSEQKRADKLVAETKALESTISRASHQLSSLNSRISATEARRAQLESQLAVIRRDVSAKRSRIATTQVAFAKRRALLGDRICAVYRQGDLFYLELLLDSRSFSDLVARTSFVQQVMLADQTIMGDLSEQRADLVKAKAALDQEIVTLSAKSTEIAADENALRGLQTDRASNLSEQSGAQDAKQSLLADTRANIAHLRDAVAAEEAEAARIERMLASGSGASHGSGRFSSSLTWPTPGHTTITSPFGWRMHPILNTPKLHTGIDIRAPYGARIVAAAAGKVIFAGDRGGYGNFTMIDHGNGLVTVYAHQSAIVVSEGRHVTKGQKIGEVGSTGMSTGPHLHFETRVNGEARDPMDYL